jgi:uncharacterized repeat protein (TIGR01451 family)
MRPLLLAAAGLSFANVLSAATIVSVHDADTSTGPGTLIIASNRALAMSWTQGQAATNVTIRAAIGFAQFSQSTPLPIIRVFLTTQLGPGTTVGTHQVATADVTVPITVPNVAVPLITLFSGLSLNPGTYFLSTFNSALGGTGTASWDFGNTAVSSDIGATAAGVYAANSPFDGTYLPASTFPLTTFGLAYFEVTGDVPSPDLTITKTHSGNFAQGSTGNTYSVIVTNSGTADKLAGQAVTVTDAPPPGLTIMAMVGSGWTCAVLPTCTRTDVLAASNAYPAITVTVSVASIASSPLVNSISVSTTQTESNPSNNTANDTTIITALPPAAIPTLSEWAMLAMIGLLMMMGLLALRGGSH